MGKTFITLSTSTGGTNVIVKNDDTDTKSINQKDYSVKYYTSNLSPHPHFFPIKSESGQSRVLLSP